MIEVRKDGKTPKSGTELLFEGLIESTKKNMLEGIIDDVYLCLHRAAKEDYEKKYSSEEVMGGYNFTIAYLILERIKLVTIKPLNEPVKLTDKGKKVYEDLIKTGVYKSLGYSKE